jgi:hypothetical protein
MKTIPFCFSLYLKSMDMQIQFPILQPILPCIVVLTAISQHLALPLKQKQKAKNAGMLDSYRKLRRAGMFY